MEPMSPPRVEILQKSKRIVSLYPPWKYIIIIMSANRIVFVCLQKPNKEKKIV